jgi:hypothetical protein
LAWQLASVLNLPVIDKDSILESLFGSEGTGDRAWRRRLSRNSDAMLQAQALASEGAILVSFWRLPGMPADSGTPTAWLSELPGRIVHLHCECAPQTAAERFLRRSRHPGHLDRERSYEDILHTLEAIAALPQIQIEPRIDVDTNQEIDLEMLARDVAGALLGRGTSA